MAQKTATVRNTLSSASVGGTTDFSVSGFGTVAAAFIFVTFANTTNNPAANAGMAVGFWDGTNARVCGFKALDNQGTTTVYQINNDGYGAAIPNAAGVASYYTVSNITDGIRLTLAVDNHSLAHYCFVTLIGGISAKALTLAPGNNNGDTATSPSLGFAPKLVFFMTTAFALVDSEDTEARFSFGVAGVPGAIVQRSITFRSRSGQSSEVADQLFSETRIGGVLGLDVVFATVEMTTLGADTYTMTSRAGTGNWVDLGGPIAYQIALGGADLSFDLGTFNTRTTTGTSQLTAAVAAESILLAFGTATGTSLETGSGANGLGFGVADANGQFSQNVSVEDAASPTNTNSAAQAAEVLDLDSSSGGSRTDLVDATVSSFNPPTLNYSVVDGTARKGFYVAFGPPPSSGTRGVPFGTRGSAFNGGRAFAGVIR